MKTAIFVLIGSLAFAGAACASDPAPQANNGNSVKIGIDAKTGQRRQLSSEESAALDARAQAQSAKAGLRSAPQRTVLAGVLIPATYAESAAAAVSKNGLTGYWAPVESYSRISVQRDADGKPHYAEDGQPMVQAREAASE